MKKALYLALLALLISVAFSVHQYAPDWKTAVEHSIVQGGFIAYLVSAISALRQ